jgi:hypothetical protein
MRLPTMASGVASRLNSASAGKMTSLVSGSASTVAATANVLNATTSGMQFQIVIVTACAWVSHGQPAQRHGRAYRGEPVIAERDEFLVIAHGEDAAHERGLPRMQLDTPDVGEQLAHHPRARVPILHHWPPGVSARACMRGTRTRTLLLQLLEVSSDERVYRDEEDHHAHTCAR